MNKLVKAILISIAAVIICVLCAFIFFPGSLAKFYISHTDYYYNIDQTMGEYEHYGEKAPDSFREISALGTVLSIPDDAERMSEDTSDRKYYVFKSDEDKLKVNFVKNETLHYARYVWLLELENDESIKNELACFKNSDCALNNYEQTAFIRNFTLDSIKTMGRGVFINSIKYGTEKRVTCDYEQSWNYENDGAVGFVDFYGCKDGIYSYVLALYDKNDLNDVHVIKIESADEEKIWQIIDSAKIKTE